MHVDGVRRTKDDFVSGVINDSGILDAKSIQEVLGIHTNVYRW